MVVPLDDILDQLSGVIESAERGNIPWGAYLDLVDDTVIVDDQMVEWKLDPMSLILFNDSADWSLSEIRNSKLKFARSLINNSTQVKHRLGINPNVSEVENLFVL